MLYGSSTAKVARGLPVRGSIAVTVPSRRPSAVFVTHSVRKSHAGTTCCGLRPAASVATTRYDAGSITETPPPRFGTYTRARSCATARAMRLRAAWL